MISKQSYLTIENRQKILFEVLRKKQLATGCPVEKSNGYCVVIPKRVISCILMETQKDLFSAVTIS